jgi:hypothetical protein
MPRYLDELSVLQQFSADFPERAKKVSPFVASWRPMVKNGGPVRRFSPDG